MGNLLEGIEEVLLMGPGPSYIHESVYEALSKKTLGHLDPYFLHGKILFPHPFKVRALTIERLQGSETKKACCPETPRSIHLSVYAFLGIGRLPVNQLNA